MHKNTNIVDLTHLIGSDIAQAVANTQSTEGKIPATFILYSASPNKLSTVKAFKALSGLGLKDAKDCVDQTNISPIMIRLYLKKEDILKYQTLFKENGDHFKLSGLDELRNKKLIELGIFNREDLSSEITELIFLDRKNIDVNIDYILSYLSEEQLKQVYKKVYESNI